MTNTSQFSLANRKHLADMLSDKYEGLRYKAKQRFSARYSALRDAIIKEFAGKRGAIGIYEQIVEAKDTIQTLKAKLSVLGFEVDHSDDLCLSDEGEELFDKQVKIRIAKDIGTEADIDARFDSAQIAMMTVASLEDADKLLKSVSSI